MLQYFVDTWHIVARFDRSDDDHAAAVRIERRISGTTLVTHDAVLTEFLAYVSAYGPHNRKAAVALVRGFLRRAIVVPVDRELFTTALDRYAAARPDKEYSLVDCMSMLVMEQRGITNVLTNDHHFTQAGFTVLFE